MSHTERCRFWRCILTGYPRPQDCPIPLKTASLVLWQYDSGRLEMFVVYKHNRSFPYALFSPWNPEVTKTTLEEYLLNPFTDPSCQRYGKRSLLRPLSFFTQQQHVSKTLKKIPRNESATRPSEPLLHAEQRLHPDLISRLRSPTVVAYGFLLIDKCLK